jgi:hypothetical protein
MFALYRQSLSMRSRSGVRWFRPSLERFEERVVPNVASAFVPPLEVTSSFNVFYLSNDVSNPVTTATLWDRFSSDSGVTWTPWSQDTGASQNVALAGFGFSEADVDGLYDFYIQANDGAGHADPAPSGDSPFSKQTYVTHSPSGVSFTSVTPSGPWAADGTSVETVSGIATGLEKFGSVSPTGAPWLLDVSTTLGTILTDADPRPGNQVTVGSDFTFAIQIRRPTTAGTPLLAATIFNPPSFPPPFIGGTKNDATFLTYTPAPLTLGPPTLPFATVGFLYQQKIAAADGSGFYSYTIGGTPPPFLSVVNGQNGVVLLNGTPTAPGTYNFSVTATDSLGATVTKNYSLTVAPPLTLGPPTLPDATAGVNYLEDIRASGGTGPYVYSVSGTPPPFLFVDVLAAAVELNGTPAAAGAYNFSVNAIDRSTGVMGTQAYTLTVGLAIDPPTLPVATAGFPYTSSLTASGGTAPYAFAFSGDPPPSFLQLSSGGVLSGLPTTPNTYSFSVTASDSLGVTGTDAYTLTVAPPLTFSPTTLPDATVGAPYSESITASGGTGTYFYSVGGTPPPFLAVVNVLGPAVVLSGTPAAAGTYNFSVTALDRTTGVMGTQAYTLTVAPPLTFSPTTLPNATVGVTYAQTITALGGTGDYDYRVDSLSGTALNFPNFVNTPTVLLLNGVPAEKGTFNFSVTAIDRNTGVVGIQSYTLTVTLPPLTLGPATLPVATAGFQYFDALTASGGTGLYSFAFSGDPPPSFLQLSSSGVLSGLPTTRNTYSFSVTATDSLGANGTHTYTLTVFPPLTFSPRTLPNATVGVTYAQTITALGGTGDYDYRVDSLSGTALNFPNFVNTPTVLLLNGTPAETGSVAFQLGARDLNTGVMGIWHYALTVSPPPPPLAGVSGPASGVPGQPRTFTFFVTDPSPVDQATGFTYQVKWDDGSSQTLPREAGAGVAVDHVYTAPGSYTVQVTATDQYGSTSPVPATQTVTVTTVALETDPVDGKTDLAIGGTPGNDTITISPADSTDMALSVNVTNVNGTTTFNSASINGHLLVYSQGGNDTISVTKSSNTFVKVPALLYGGGTGTKDNDTISVAGSAANNVLFGGAGKGNTLTGGVGRDLLIAGMAASTLNAGSGDDILIGGSTAYDLSSPIFTYNQKLIALYAIMSEWGTNESYLQRVANLQNFSATAGTQTVAPDGTYKGFFLNPFDVHDNQKSDIIYGTKSNSTLDWFLADTTTTNVIIADSVKNQNSGEVVTQIN